MQCFDTDSVLNGTRNDNSNSTRTDILRHTDFVKNEPKTFELDQPAVVSTSSERKQFELRRIRRTRWYTNSVKMQNADESYVTECSELVSRLITQLEGLVATTSDESDMVQTSQYRELCGAISLILPDVLCDIFQMCFLFGSKRWRK